MEIHSIKDIIGMLAGCYRHINAMTKLPMLVNAICMMIPLDTSTSLSV